MGAQKITSQGSCGQSENICRVWTEVDDLGVPRRVCSEYPTLTVFVSIEGPATGAYEGGGGYDDGKWHPALIEPLAESTSSGAIHGAGMPSAVAQSDCLVYNVAEGTGNGIPYAFTGGGNRKPRLLGYRWGWTAEETPRQLIIIDARAADPVTEVACKLRSRKMHTALAGYTAFSGQKRKNPGNAGVWNGRGWPRTYIIS